MQAKSGQGEIDEQMTDAPKNCEDQRPKIRYFWGLSCLFPSLVAVPPVVEVAGVGFGGVTWPADWLG